MTLLFDVTPHRHYQHRNEECHEDVVPRKSRKVEERRRESEHHRGEQRSHVSQLVSQKQGNQYQRRAEQNHPQPQREFRIAEQEEHRGDQLEQKHPVRQWRVFILVADRYLISEVAVQTLVVMHRLVAQTHQTHSQPDKEKSRINPILNTRR